MGIPQLRQTLQGPEAQGLIEGVGAVVLGIAAPLDRFHLEKFITLPYGPVPGGAPQGGADAPAVEVGQHPHTEDLRGTGGWSPAGAIKPEGAPSSSSQAQKGRLPQVRTYWAVLSGRPNHWGQRVQNFGGDGLPRGWILNPPDHRGPPVFLDWAAGPGGSQAGLPGVWGAVPDGFIVPVRRGGATVFGKVFLLAGGIWYNQWYQSEQSR